MEMRRVNLIILNKLPACLTSFLDPHMEFVKSFAQVGFPDLSILPKKTRKSRNFWPKIENGGMALVVLEWTKIKMSWMNKIAFDKYRSIRLKVLYLKMARNLGESITLSAVGSSINCLIDASSI